MSERIQIYESKISGLFLTVGMVGRYSEHVADEMLVEAVALAPVGRAENDTRRPPPGTLKASHRKGGALSRGGQYGHAVVIRNTAKHAPWVAGGTTGPIRGRGLLWLPGLRPNGGPNGRFAVPFVRGQSANPWLEDAVRTVLLRHGVL